MQKLLEYFKKIRVEKWKEFYLPKSWVFITQNFHAWYKIYVDGKGLEDIHACTPKWYAWPVYQYSKNGHSGSNINKIKFKNKDSWVAQFFEQR